jgi:hypothetical protein
VKICKHHGVLIVPIMLLLQVVATTQEQIPASAASLETSPRSLADAAQKRRQGGLVVQLAPHVIVLAGHTQPYPMEWRGRPAKRAPADVRARRWRWVW